MNGEELREVLRREMAATTSPPAMSAAAALDAARRARVRHRTLWACTGSVAAVLAIAGVVGAVGFPGSSWLGAGGLSQPSPDDTRQWFPTGPNGEPQQARTASAGPRYEKAVQLLNEIVSVMPDGYTATETPPNLPLDQIPMRDHQAEFQDWVNGAEWWRYTAWATFAQGPRMGRLLVEVHTAGSRFPAEPCALTQYFWVVGGECELVTVETAQVGVVVLPGQDNRFDQWAAYRYPDGVVVFVAQAKEIFGAERPGLPALPFTVEQLANLAVDPRFHVM